MTTYLDRVVGSLLVGVLGTVVLLMGSIAVSWGFGLTWQVPFVLWVEAHEGYVLFEPHLVGLVAVVAVLATSTAAAARRPTRCAARSSAGCAG
ncbi:MAG TPA: hypothetical protein VNT27_09915 [Propionibacteriaceae bacterium]|nr:hypothetical protein [Propionibacteriaceae bacterium]